MTPTMPPPRTMASVVTSPLIGGNRRVSGTRSNQGDDVMTVSCMTGLTGHMTWLKKGDRLQQPVVKFRLHSGPQRGCRVGDPFDAQCVPRTAWRLARILPAFSLVAPQR